MSSKQVKGTVHSRLLSKGDVAEQTTENPYVPSFISNAPWYAKAKGKEPEKKTTTSPAPTSMADWYKRGAKGETATKFRKGACENCGAMTHTAKDCVERPRSSKQKAKFSNADIKADEVVTEIDLAWEAKRDRWNGYDPSAHFRVMERYQALDDAKETLKADEEGKGEDDVDGFKEEEEVVFDHKGDAKTRTTIRNLRIREDTAVYLRKDKNQIGVYYDAKSRSMRDVETNKRVDDEWILNSGEVQDFKKSQMFAFQAANSGQIPAGLEATPTAATLFKKQSDNLPSLAEERRQKLVEVYGGGEHLAALPKELLVQDAPQHFTAGHSLTAANSDKSRYEEDCYPGNHTSVWGSYWRAGQWGYKCCHQLIKLAVCLGQAGIQQEAQELALAQPKSELQLMIEQQRYEEEKRIAKKQKKLAKKEKKRRKAEGVPADSDSKKTKFNSFKADAELLTPQQIEEYKRSRLLAEDPMAKFL